MNLQTETIKYSFYIVLRNKMYRKSYNKFLYIFIIISFTASILCISTFSFESVFAQKEDKEDRYIYTNFHLNNKAEPNVKICIYGMNQDLIWTR